MHEIKWLWRESGFKKLCKFMGPAVSISCHKLPNSDSMTRRVMEDQLENISEASYQPKVELGDLKQSIESKKRQYHNMDLQSFLTQEVEELSEWQGFSWNEFFPVKDARGTTSKELEFPTIASSVAVAGGSSEAAASITVFTPYGDATASNSVDLSLQL